MKVFQLAALQQSHLKDCSDFQKISTCGKKQFSVVKIEQKPSPRRGLQKESISSFST